MKLILATVALASLIQRISAADLDGIQNATPIGIPLNNPSLELGGVNNGDAAQKDENLGGYRPLYPPYFNLNRKSNEQQKQYYDKEYYSRGAQAGNFESRLDRTFRTPAPAPAFGFAPDLTSGLIAPDKASDDVEVYVVNLNSQSQPESVVQLQNQPQSQLPVPPQLPLPTQVQHQSQIPLQSQQYGRQFSSFRTQQSQHAHSYFYNFKFPSS